MDMVKESSVKREVVLGESLQGYFFEELKKISDQSSRPLPQKMILYSSLVMSSMGESKKYFDTREGKVREKILGIKLMESNQMPVEQRKRVLRDIGDTSLLLCGYFFKSVANKIVDIGYYQELGKTAYRWLDAIVPEMYDTVSFFKMIAEFFDDITAIISIIANNLGKSEQQNDGFVFLFNDVNLKVS